MAHPLQERMQGIGPMGKSVQDIELSYKIISNNPIQSQSMRKNLDIIFLPNLPDYPLSEETQKMYEHVRDNMTDKSIREDIPPYFHDNALLWQEIMSIDGGDAIKRKGFVSDRAQILKEYIKEKTAKNSQYHEYFTWALIGAKLFKPSKRRQQEIEEIIVKGDQKINTYLKNRLLIFPVYHQGALPHGSL